MSRVSTSSTPFPARDRDLGGARRHAHQLGEVASEQGGVLLEGAPVERARLIEDPAQHRLWHARFVGDDDVLDTHPVLFEPGAGGREGRAHLRGEHRVEPAAEPAPAEPAAVFSSRTAISDRLSRLRSSR
ncbi:hypothetical protein [Actinomadura chokoriensis]|uniref:Uncharacterized protein n=1 Tax=Actinomadura chokoriensis TaxID=454156 RepID=A0ABV4R403_9ACTN